MKVGRWAGGFLLVGLGLVPIRGHSRENPHRHLTLPCAQCHTEEGWHPLKDPLPFDHAATGFPLTGAHRGVACRNCHDIEDFSRVSPRCSTCHQDPHESRWGLDCERCHDPTTWTVRDLSRVHARTTFPFVGPHARLDCEVCHRKDAPQEFALLHTQCYACHEDAYRAVQDPPHGQLGFPTSCELCHTMFRWRPAGFRQHDRYFPIFSGSHAGVWSSCRDCHPSGYQDFTCLTCHTESATRAQHGEVGGFVYESHACLQCHPTGSGEGEGGD